MILAPRRQRRGNGLSPCSPVGDATIGAWPTTLESGVRVMTGAWLSKRGAKYVAAGQEDNGEDYKQGKDQRTLAPRGTSFQFDHLAAVK